MVIGLCPLYAFVKFSDFPGVPAMPRPPARRSARTCRAERQVEDHYPEFEPVRASSLESSFAERRAAPQVRRESEARRTRTPAVVQQQRASWLGRLLVSRSWSSTPPFPFKRCPRRVHSLPSALTRASLSDSSCQLGCEAILFTKSSSHSSHLL